MEYFDICDAQGNPVGGIVERSTAHRDGICHRTAHIWVVRQSEGKTQVLLQKRSRNKDSFPGQYDTSSAGHIQAGDEPLESACRELKEELGIGASPEDLEYAGIFRVKYEEVFHGSVFRDNEAAFVYVYRKPVETEKLHLQTEEVEGVAWFDLEEVYQGCLREDERFCVPIGGLRTMMKFLEQKNGKQGMSNIDAGASGSPQAKTTDSEQIQILAAEPSDAEELLRIYAPYVLHTAITFEYTVPEVEEFRGRIIKVLEKYPYIKAVHEGKIVGYAYVHPFVGRAAYDWAVETSIYVDQKVRKKGIGKALYESLEKILAKMNIVNLNACIGVPETPDEYLTNNSVEFHEHMGYRMVGRFHKCGYKFGRWYDMVWMEKMLGEHPEHPEPVRSFHEIKW